MILAEQRTEWEDVHGITLESLQQGCTGEWRDPQLHKQYVEGRFREVGQEPKGRGRKEERQERYASRCLMLFYMGGDSDAAVKLL